MKIADARAWCLKQFNQHSALGKVPCCCAAWEAYQPPKHFFLPQTVSMMSRGGIMGLHSNCFTRTSNLPEGCRGGGEGGPHQQPSRSNKPDHLDQALRRHVSSSASAGGGQSKEGGKWTLQGLLPAPAWPYAQLMRLDKPIGTWLLAWPGFW